MKTTNSLMLRWILGQGSARIACEIQQNADRTFALRIVPSWGEQPGVIGRFTDLVNVMARHAEVAGRLRDAGWRVIERSPAQRLAA